MKKVAIFVLFFGTWLFAAGEVAPELSAKYRDSSKCAPCHAQIVSEWSESYHAKSHYDNNEYLRASMDYVSRKSRKSLNAVKVDCATCHNPRLGVNHTDMDYEIQAAMGLDKMSKVNEALESDAISEGINCLVCHNVDKINDHLDDTKRGMDRISWNPVGTMSGPIKDAVSPYHNTQYREFFGKNPKQLCFVCHANDRSVSGLVFTDMKSEYGDEQKQCADCHMSPKKEGYASNYPIDDGQPKKRMVREHGFVGAHTEWMWKGALGINVSQKGKDLIVTLVNDNPHNIPSGFGSRELIIEVTYMSGSKVMKKQSMSLTRHYKSKRGKPTIPHLAVEASEDLSVPAKGTRSVKFPMAEGAGAASVALSYRLVNDEVRGILKLKEPIWSKKFYIDTATYRIQ